MANKQQTAVEWYVKQLARIGVTEELIGHLTKEAKQMEKEQIIEANLQGQFHADGIKENTVAEQYYNENFKNTDNEKRID